MQSEFPLTQSEFPLTQFENELALFLPIANDLKDDETYLEASSAELFVPQLDTQFMHIAPPLSQDFCIQLTQQP
jgi:hypothetical protein